MPGSLGTQSAPGPVTPENYFYAEKSYNPKYLRYVKNIADVIVNISSIGLIPEFSDNFVA